MCYFFFNDTATTEIYTLSLHDALPIFLREGQRLEHLLHRAPQEGVDHGEQADREHALALLARSSGGERLAHPRSEEHTSELQSRQYLVCRLLLEKKKINKSTEIFYLHV